MLYVLGLMLIVDTFDSESTTECAELQIDTPATSTMVSSAASSSTPNAFVGNAATAASEQESESMPCLDIGMLLKEKHP